MKTKNLIIGVLAIAVIVLSFLLYRAYNVSEKSYNKSAQLTLEEAEFFCVENLDANDGGIIGLDDAKIAIKEFERLNSTDSVKAFHIGLKTLRSMMDSIKVYNDYSRRQGVKDTITGVRFYRGITSRSFTSPTTGKPFPVKERHDLVIVPTVLNNDLYVVRDTVSFLPKSVPIYSYTRPCPKLCGSKYISSLKGSKKEPK